jgi:AAA+ ATPase superfamily predicted ATPase
MKDYINRLASYFLWSFRQFYLFTCLPTWFERELEGAGLHKANLSYVGRIRYLLKFAPWIVIFNGLVNLLAGYICKSYGITFEWGTSWLGVLVGVAGGIAFGATSGISLGIGGGLGGWALGVALGMAGGMSFSLIMSAVGSTILGILAGVIFRRAFGKASGVRIAITIAVAVALSMAVAGAVMAAYWLRMKAGLVGGTTPRLTVGLAVGLAFGIAGGIASGLGFGVTFNLRSGAAFGVVGGMSFGLAFGVAIASVAGTLAGVAAGTAFAVSFLILFGLTYFRLITYPIDVALSSISYLIGREHRHKVERAWRWCPIRWNEVIWLPLPFIGRLLVILVRQDREEGFKKIAFVAAERPLQRQVALTALVEVAIDDLHVNTLSELSTVTEEVNWTTDAPGGELPSILAAALPRFDRIAQHVGQYVTLNSAYRKSEALERAAVEMDALQRVLISTQGQYATRLLRVENQWRGLLDAERGKIQTLIAGSREIPNPFVSGNPVVETEHNVFTGRRDIVRHIEASVVGASQTPTLLLHGPRRMGKTSILNQLPRLLGPDFAPTSVDCQNPAVVGSEATLLRYLSRALSVGLRQRRVSVEPLAAAALASEPFAAFDEWLDGVEQAMPEGMRALLCLDEYERLQATLDAGWGGKFLDALRHTLQHRPRMVLMFTGARTFEELGPAWTDRFISARRVRVSFLERDDVELLLTKPIPEFNMTYAQGALDVVVAATNGQPFLTQAVAFELVQLLNERQRKEATPCDVEESVARALTSGGEYFANVWSDAGEQGQAILRAVARGEAPPAFYVASAWLREHDVLNIDGDFAVEMMRRWVKNKII